MPFSFPSGRRIAPLLPAQSKSSGNTFSASRFVTLSLYSFSLSLSLSLSLSVSLYLFLSFSESLAFRRTWTRTTRPSRTRFASTTVVPPPHASLNRLRREIRRYRLISLSLALSLSLSLSLTLPLSLSFSFFRTVAFSQLLT